MVDNEIEIQRQVCAVSADVDWDSSWNRRHPWPVTRMFLKQPSDNSFSRAFATFDVASHQDCMCPHRMKVVIFQWLCCLLLDGSQWHLSKIGVRRWTWYNSTSTSGCITTTGWTWLTLREKIMFEWWQDIVLHNFAERRLQAGYLVDLREQMLW